MPGKGTSVNYWGVSARAAPPRPQGTGYPFTPRFAAVVPPVEPAGHPVPAFGVQRLQPGKNQRPPFEMRNQPPSHKCGYVGTESRQTMEGAGNIPYGWFRLPRLPRFVPASSRITGWRRFRNVPPVSIPRPIFLRQDRCVFASSRRAGGILDGFRHGDGRTRRA